MRQVPHLRQKFVRQNRDVRRASAPSPQTGPPLPRRRSPWTPADGWPCPDLPAFCPTRVCLCKGGPHRLEEAHLIANRQRSLVWHRQRKRLRSFGHVSDEAFLAFLQRRDAGPRCTPPPPTAHMLHLTRLAVLLFLGVFLLVIIALNTLGALLAALGGLLGGWVGHYTTQLPGKRAGAV